MNYLLLLVLAVAVRWLPVQGFTYMAVVPNEMRPNSKLMIPIKFDRRITGEAITAQMFDKRDEQRVIAETSVIVNGKSEAVVELQVPSSISWGNYRVNITGAGPIPFKNSTLVYGSTKALSIFVQTDKAMYKPGDTVQYRVFTVDGSLAPINPLLNIEFFDPKGNKIDERMKVTANGVESVVGELSLSDMPPLGNWRIEVTAPAFGETAKETYNFEVREYVLPKFEVTVTLPAYGLVKGTSLKGTVKAEYVFGKPVQGTVVLDIKRSYSGGFYDIAAARTELSINGEATFDVQQEILRRLSRNLEYATFIVSANVTETITGITMQGTGRIQYYEQPYQIEFHPSMPDNFKPGFNPYTVSLKVSDRDGKPPIGVTEQVKIDITYFLEQAVTVPILNNLTIPNYEFISPFVPGETVIINTMMYPLQTDGTVQFDINIPSGTATASIKAEFAGESTTKQLSRFRSPGDLYFKVEILNAAPLKIGDIASVQVNNSKGAVMAHYIVKAKGLTVQTGTINIGGNGLGMLHLKLTREMAPSARIVVYYVAPNNEIAADGINFIIEDIYENKVTIQFDQTSVQPKTGVNLKVMADSGSVVNVLAVDKSVRLLKEGNDITQDRVSAELRRYGDSPWISLSSGWGRVLPWSFTADDASDIFNNARLTVLSDGLLPDFNLWSLRRSSKSSPRSVAFASSGMMNSAPMGGGGGPPEPVGQIRKDFLETWVWKSAVAKNGVATFPDIAPDSITTYIASAYALNINSGLGVVTNTADLQVVLPFFVNLQLPYGIVRGEVAVIQANIFNSHPEDMYVNVTLRGSPDFVVVTIDANGNEVDVTGSQEKCVLVRSNSPTPVFFNVKPTIIGTLQLSVRATVTTPRAIFDEVIRDIPVKAEGEQKEANIPVMISMPVNGFTQEVKTWPTSPPDLVIGSEKARFTVIGDIFGPSTKNLNKLIRLPYGCGEQNMLNFAPSIFAAVYMNVTGRFADDIELQQKIINALKTGYQRQLLYQRNDGSFSAFGNADNEGSLWLTAFVIKSFAQANKLKLIFIDPKVVERAVNFIIDRQTPDGKFENIGIVNNKAMQGSSASSSRTLTAYVNIALTEVKDAGFLDGLTLVRLESSLQQSTNYLTQGINQMTADYEKAIGAYALKLRNNAMASTLLTGLENSPNKQQSLTEKYWKNPSHSLELEIASYALMTYTENGATDAGYPILKWLISNRGPFGGYASTQDTVVAIQATSQFAALVYSPNVNLRVDIIMTRNGVLQPKIPFVLNATTQDILQFKEVDKFDSVTIEATGIGLAMVDVNIFYNIHKEETEAYILTVKTTAETKNSYLLTACAKFNITNSLSNMAILDIGVLSGFEPVKDQVVKGPLMKRIDESARRLIVYFDEIPSREVCVDVPVQRVELVSGVKPATVNVYSYYEPSERKMVSYLPTLFQTSTLCSICGSECGCSAASSGLPMSQCAGSGGGGGGVSGSAGQAAFYPGRA